MTDTILKIFQTIANGLKMYNDSKKNLFENFLQPAMDDFDKVHQDYLNSFKNYSTLLDESSKPLNRKHPVFKMIKEDALFSMNIRERVYSFCDYSNIKGFENFSSSLLDYFQYSAASAEFNNTLQYEMETCFNIKRQEAFEGLLYIIENKDMTNKKTLALKQIEMAVKNLQVKYRKVIDNYNALKIELMK